MSYVNTLIAPQQDENTFAAILKHLENNAHTPENIQATSNVSYDFTLKTPLPRPLLDSIRTLFRTDIIQQPAAARKKRLFFADMDATIVEQETLDELAAFAGLKDKIAAITARAMAGELDFKAALAERVALLAGLPESALAATARTTTFTKGAKTLLQTLKASGVHCVLVSGGFTYFTQHTADALGFDAHYGNTLDIENGTLTGRVIPPVLDKNFKQACLIETAARLNIDLADTVAIGDGANDLPMLQTAGLGIGFRPKPLLFDAVENHLLHTGLDAVLYALGLTPPHRA